MKNICLIIYKKKLIKNISPLFLYPNFLERIPITSIPIQIPVTEKILCVLLRSCVCFDKIYVRCCTMCIVYSKINFITNITNFIRIHIFYFYNNKHIFINSDTTFITKRTNFIKINTDLVTALNVPLFIYLFIFF